MFSVMVPASIELTWSLSGWWRRCPLLALEHVDNVQTVDALQSCVQTLHCSKWQQARQRRRWDTVERLYSERMTHSLLALLPSRVAHRLSSAELCSSSELGFSTRILLMSSTLSCSSRASSEMTMFTSSRLYLRSLSERLFLSFFFGRWWKRALRLTF